MDEITKYWLSRVSAKLFKRFMQGMDFETYEHRWIYDWDINETDEKNLEKVDAEDKALVLLASIGAIRSSVKPNYFRDQQYEGWERFGEEHSMWGERWGKTDPAHREYDYIRFIDGINLDKFISFCEEMSINYKNDNVNAALKIVNQTPIVRVNGQDFQLKPLQSGVPLEIIEQVIAHPGEQVTFEKLRKWTGKVNLYKDEKNNFNQIFRGNEFGKGNILHPFVFMKTKTLSINETASITPTELSVIQKASLI